MTLLAFLLAACARDGATQVGRVGDHEIPTDSAYPRWWARASRCVGVTAPYDTKLRYFVGDTIPREWNAITEQGATTIGYTDQAAHLILLSRGYEQDSMVIVHEQLHDYLKVSGHPPQYFADSVAARCGYLPGVDDGR